MLKKLLDILKKGNDKLLYKINNDEITYRECYEKVLKLADSLRKQGNSSVIVYGHKSINQFISILACVVARRCYIPIDKCTPVNRINEIIELANVDLVIKNENIELDKDFCFNIDEINDKYSNVSNYFEIDNDFAYIIFTSGSTGNSKGVPITYSNLDNFINWIIIREEFSKCNNIRVLSQASFSFDLSVMDIYFSIYKGCSIIAIDGNTKEDLLKMYNIIGKEKVNFLILTPTFIKMLLIDDCFNENNFPNIKYLFFCGECLEVETVKKIKNRFSKVSVINAYGPTEATCCVSLLNITNDMLNDRLIPVGKISTSAVDISINNQEIILKGESVFNGYLNFVSSNFYIENNINCYKSGDIGYILDGYLYCIGRLDSQIKYQGYRIELGDIENNLLRIKGIREAVVVCKYKENTNLVRLIKAFVTVDNNITEKDIKQELCKLIPNYMIPKKIVIIEEIPVNNNGKYDRKKLYDL
jgi:D-alanine--poly(phosphoribitol) ligase subunit 1